MYNIRIDAHTQIHTHIYIYCIDAPCADTVHCARFQQVPDGHLAFPAGKYCTQEQAVSASHRAVHCETVRLVTGVVSMSTAPCP